MEKILNRFYKSSIITSIVLLGLGLLLIYQSEKTIISISYVLGAILIAIGTLAIINYILRYNDEIKRELDIVYGVVSIILGILVISNPQAIASIIPLVIGVGIMISSATKIQYALELKKANNSLWKTTLIVSIITAICGVVLLFNPFAGALLITRIVGILIVIYSILDIFSTITIKRNVKEIHDTIEYKVVDAEIIEEKEHKETKEKKNKKTKKKK